MKLTSIQESGNSQEGVDARHRGPATDEDALKVAQRRP